MTLIRHMKNKRPKIMRKEVVSNLVYNNKKTKTAD